MPPARYKNQVIFMADDNLRARIHVIARREGVSLSEVCREYVETGVYNHRYAQGEAGTLFDFDAEVDAEIERMRNSRLLRQHAARNLGSRANGHE